ncbi:MAG: Endonuclease 4 [Chlamydiae bacterium]|nr:Endonuclease 4 [Chlamydiota bacterium]
MAKTPPEKLLIGAHTSTAGGVHNALLQGEEIGATTIQIFTSNQKQWQGREITKEIADLWKKTREETRLKKIMSHSSYLINLGSPKEEMREKSVNAFQDELKRCHKLEIDFLNFHPGAATESTTEECLEQIVSSLKKFEKLCAAGSTRLLLETTAGQGSSVGHEFEHLAFIIEELKSKIPIGVCIDTCHIFAAGYDIRTKKAWEKTLDEFDDVIGLKHLYGFHLNDSMKPFASRRDRHAHLGEGEIGIEAFRFMMQHEKLREIPKYLETPKGLSIWKDEIAQLRKFAK